MAFAAWVWAEADPAASLSEAGHYDIPIYGPSDCLLITVGASAAVATFMGAFAFANESNCGLTIYAFLLLVCEAGVITGVVLAYDKDAEVDLIQGLSNSMYMYNENAAAKADIVSDWNELQKVGVCCGVNSYADWRMTPQFRHSQFKVPEMCCQNIDDLRTSSEIRNCQLYPEQFAQDHGELNGCKDKVTNDLEKHQNRVLGASISEIFFIILNFLFVIIGCTI